MIGSHDDHVATAPRGAPIGGDDDVLDVTAAMTVLKLGRNAVYDGCARGQIPHRRIGKLLRFSHAGLRAWLSSATTVSTFQRTARG
jgi:predicted DNA-binding transcriptional regulator AlpA